MVVAVFVVFVVVVAAGGWGWKVARGDSGCDGFVHVNESHVVGASAARENILCDRLGKIVVVG